MADSIARLVRKEVSLGTIRDVPPPTTHAGLRLFAPWLEVATDDVIFDYIASSGQEGLAPARAEDAEAELAQKDDLRYGKGRASLIDWALKDKYTASDVSRYRTDLFLAQQAEGAIASGAIPYNYVANQVSEFNNRLARDEATRRRKLDNRIEWLIMQAIETGAISYNDGRIKFSVNFGRPSNQQDQAPAGGLWGVDVSDPIGDILAMNTFMYNLYGIKMDRCVISTDVANAVWKSDKFKAAVGVPIVGGTPNVPLDPNYLGLAGYTPQGALRLVTEATGVEFEVYDAIYRTRAIGSTSTVNNRFLSRNKAFFYPSAAQIQEIDDTEIGFGKTLTAPHPEGNWQPGFYEWEDETKDPWMHVRGTGVKAFPVFPYMELTYTMAVLA